MKLGGASGLAVLIGWLVNRRESEGRARQASGAGARDEAEGRHVDADTRREDRTWVVDQAVQAAKRAEEARQKAEDACTECHEQVDSLRRDYNEQLNRRDFATYDMLAKYEIMSTLRQRYAVSDGPERERLADDLDRAHEDLDDKMIRLREVMIRKEE
ncbi:hypothetical protein ACXYX3_17555 [Mycobacterium sp. C3-094]